MVISFEVEKSFSRTPVYCMSGLVGRSWQIERILLNFCRGYSSRSWSFTRPAVLTKLLDSLFNYGRDLLVDCTSRKGL